MKQVLLSTPEGYANKCCLCDSQLNNKYLQRCVERHSTQWQQLTKIFDFIWGMLTWWAEVSSWLILSKQYGNKAATIYIT